MTCHRQEIARNEADLQAMEAGTYRHYDTDADGRLTRDTTERMRDVARHSIQVHQQSLALGEVCNSTP